MALPLRLFLLLTAHGSRVQGMGIGSNQKQYTRATALAFVLAAVDDAYLTDPLKDIHGRRCVRALVRRVVLPWGGG